MSKNYIVYKDINSDTFDNLIISELSPISSPETRVDITEIDGADGDIVDELGYKAYDKSIKIGLKNSKNIDKIIKFFSGSGNLVLSNEPDKVYIARIYKKIDYERLLTFRTAKVTFHVQPFKYALNEAPFVFNITDETEVKVTNIGFEKSKPIITLYGSGEVTLTINGYDVFTINIDDEYVVIDSMQLEAYKNSTLKNRNMTGKFPILDVGINTISWTGKLTKLIVEPKSRWL